MPVKRLLFGLFTRQSPNFPVNNRFGGNRTLISLLAILKQKRFKIRRHNTCPGISAGNNILAQPVMQIFRFFQNSRCH